MKPSGETTITASRLRAGDRLAAYHCATIMRPPIVSPDGSMMTVLLQREPTGREAPPLKVLRIPIDQPVDILRAGSEDRPNVRKAKTARSSGAQIVVLDLAHPDSEFAALNGERYATLCTTHHTIKFHTSVSTADAISSHPEEWCAECATATRIRAQNRLGSTNGSAAQRFA